MNEMDNKWRQTARRPANIYFTSPVSFKSGGIPTMARFTVSVHF